MKQAVTPCVLFIWSESLPQAIASKTIHKMLINDEAACVKTI